MVSIERFEILLEQAMSSLPAKLFERLNLGVGLQDAAKLNHGTASGQPAYTLGEYHVRQRLGRGIVLYYCSFVQVYPGLSDEGRVLDLIAGVLRHELTHHWEHLAGERDLEIEDARRLLKM